MINNTNTENRFYMQPNCAFFNKTTHTCRYCQDKFIECLGEEACDMFYNAEQARLADPENTPLSTIVKRLGIQHAQLQLMAQELEAAHEDVAQAKSDYDQLLTDKNSIEERLVQARMENTRLHEENRRASLKFASSSTNPNINKAKTNEQTAEILSLQNEIQSLTEQLISTKDSLAKLQQENSLLKQENTLYSQSSPAGAPGNSEKIIDVIAENIQTLSQQLLNDNKTLTEKLILSNKELSRQLTDESQEKFQKLIGQAQALSTSVTNSNRDLAERLLSDSDEKVKHNYHIIDQIRKQRQALENIEQSLGKIDTSAGMSKIALAILAGIIAGCLATLAGYHFILR